LERRTGENPEFGTKVPGTPDVPQERTGGGAGGGRQLPPEASHSETGPLPLLFSAIDSAVDSAIDAFSSFFYLRCSHPMKTVLFFFFRERKKRRKGRKRCPRKFQAIWSSSGSNVQRTDPFFHEEKHRIRSFLQRFLLLLHYRRRRSCFFFCS
jgi:hypothetical protein